MSADDDAGRAQAGEALRWLHITERDIATAAHCLTAEPPLVESAAYFAQQGAEKLIKALLVAAAAPFPKTHDLKDLAARAAPHYPALDTMLQGLAPMTIWGVAYRYPAEEEIAALPPTPAMVEQAVSELRSLRQVVEQLFRQKASEQ